MKLIPKTAYAVRDGCVPIARIAQNNRLSRIIAAGAIVLALVSCTDMPTGGVGDTGFKKQYFQARNHLEKGNVEKALASYRRLAQERGPFESRILLELSHAYLRATDFDAARRTVQSLNSSSDTRMRAAALAVTGTAEQEMGRRRLVGGDRGKVTKAHFRAAQKALSAVLKLHPDMDQTGGMATRLGQIKAQLKQL